MLSQLKQINLLSPQLVQWKQTENSEKKSWKTNMLDEKASLLLVRYSYGK